MPEAEAVDTQPVELTIDDLFNQPIDGDTVKAAEKELLLKAGTWTSVPPWSPKISKVTDDKGSRTVVRFFGKVKLLDKDGNETDQGAIGYGISPDRRNAIDWTTKEPTDKPDRLYKNYIMACKAYRTAYEVEPTNIGDLVKYLRDYEHRVRIMQTEGMENMVVAISAVPPVRD